MHYFMLLFIMFFNGVSPLTRNRASQTKYTYIANSRIYLKGKYFNTLQAYFTIVPMNDMIVTPLDITILTLERLIRSIFTLFLIIFIHIRTLLMTRKQTILLNSIERKYNKENLQYFESYTIKIL